MPRGSRLSIFVLVDALGWRVLEGEEFLSDLLPYRRPLRTVLGYSSGAIPSILTGLPPCRTGRWNLLYYDPEGSPFRRLRSVGAGLKLLDNRMGKKLVKEAGRRLLGLGPLFECGVSPRLLPYFNWSEKRSIYASGGIDGAASIFDFWEQEGRPYRVYSYQQWNDDAILKTACGDVRAGAASAYFLYLSEMDALLHQHCHERALVRRRLLWYAGGLRSLFETALHQDSSARLAVFSDHGMTPVTHEYDVAAAIAGLGCAMPSDYLAVYDSTMARFWLFRDRSRREIPARLAALPCGRILPDAELSELGVLFPDRRYGELIFLMHPGWLIASGDFNGPGWMPAGMHGYHPDDPHSDGLYMSNVACAPAPRAITDIFALMRGEPAPASAIPR